MKKYFFIIFILLGITLVSFFALKSEKKTTKTEADRGSFSQPAGQPVVPKADPKALKKVLESENSSSLPISEYVSRRKLKGFGEYIQDRFTGYHVADDIEYGDRKDLIPVTAIADGVVLHSGRVSGYGGVIVIRHTMNGEPVNAIYGHLALSSSGLKPGDPVQKSHFLSNLGEDNSVDTDGERKHLHFALYKGDELRLQGYETRAESVLDWINPNDFFSGQGLSVTSPTRIFDPSKELGGSTLNIEFIIPEGLEVEYVSTLKALNLYTLAGGGTARERSQIFIRYFDADQFLTLSTVNVLKSENLTIGQGNYQARQYEIEKKAGVPAFSEQPSWRNQRHIVTDFRGRAGRTRYYVIAANPELDKKIYEEILGSMDIK